jgi:YbgC/YbaW family acyl-CoA thioester hydrolase
MTSQLPEVVFHIYPADCDMLGHVNHATMLGFLERARWALLEREEVGGVRDFATVPIVSVVRHVDIDYFAQSLPGEDLAIRSGLLAVKNTSYIVKQDVKKVGSGVVVAQASIVFVAIDRAGKPTRVPDEWRTLLPHWPDEE